MGKVFIAIVAVFASLALVESLVCNKCSFNLLKMCFPSSTTETCNSNTSVCYNETHAFSFLSDTLTVSSYGCRETNSSCGNATVGSALTLGITTTTGCCSTDKCFTVNSAPSTKMTFAATVTGAILTAMWGSIM